MEDVNAVLDIISINILEYSHLIKGEEKDVWERGFAKKLVRLAQGVGGRIKGTNTIKFIRREELPKGYKVTYGWIVSDFKPHKEEQHWVRLTVGGDRIYYNGDFYTAGASIITVKTHLNIFISTKNAWYACGDIKNFYLNTKLPTPKYMHIAALLIPCEIINEYSLEDIVDNE